jgi:hypothetical protein
LYDDVAVAVLSSDACIDQPRLKGVGRPEHVSRKAFDRHPLRAITRKPID